MAIVHVGISRTEFWSLTWFEWGCYLLKFEKQIEKEKAEWEDGWDRTRHIMTILANVHGNKKVPSDFIKLSRDKEVEKVLLTPEQVESMFPKKINIDGK